MIKRNRKEAGHFGIYEALRVATTVGFLFVGTVVSAEAPKWGLAWEDDFNSFNGTNWTKVNTTQPTNNSLQAYLPQQVTTESGNLVITATDQPYQSLDYRSGQVISKSEQRFGRWEIRAKLPTSAGMWPAIWLLPDVNQHNWPSGGEIDILENRGNEPELTSSAFHYGTNPPYKHNFVYAEQRTAIDGQLENFHDSFHTYAVDWTDRYVRFYVDGVNHYTVYDEDVDNFFSQNTQPMQLVINNAVGGDFLPNPDGTTQWPQRMEIDWVRVYDLDEGPGTAEFVNGDFETDGGTLSGWSLFGLNSKQIQNVQVSTQAVQEGAVALKLYGTFGAGGQYSGISQGITVEAGETITASASAFVRSQDSINGTDNQALMKIEFYDAFGSKYDNGLLGETVVELADGSVVNDAWTSHDLEAVAPAGAVEARLAFVFHQPGSDGGAVFVDAVSFGVEAPELVGDFNNDGQVDAADYTVWRDSQNQTGADLPADANKDGQVNGEDYNLWVENYGNSQTSAIAVPEPTMVALTTGAAVTALLFSHRRNTP